jgi:hypothetical protein
VRLDPRLIWIWGVVGWHVSGSPVVPTRIKKLEQWDPGNALPYLILAQREDAKRGAGSFLHPRKPSAVWLEAMEGAFSSNRIDDYTDRLRALDRIVARRYGLNDPYFVVEMWNGFYMPGRLGMDSIRYAKLAIASGDALESRGDLKGATEKYLQVAKFLHLYGPYASMPSFVDGAALDVYTRLAGVYKKMGNAPQSAYFADLAATARYDLEQYRVQWRGELEKRPGIFGVTPWSALTVELADAGMMASAFLLLIAIVLVLAKSRSLKPGRLRVGRATTVLGLIGAGGLLVSSIALYVAYRPYAAIYTRFLQTGDTSQLKMLRDFLEFTRTPFATQMYRPFPGHHGPVVVFSPYVSTHAFTFYFWLAVTVMGLATLAVLGGRHLLKRSRPRADAAA